MDPHLGPQKPDKIMDPEMSADYLISEWAVHLTTSSSVGLS